MSSSITSHYMRPPRHFSNKENASYAPGAGSASTPPTSLPFTPAPTSGTPRRTARGKSNSSAVAAATIAHLGKPRMGGIGRAPKRSATSAARHSHGKPYDRSTSVTRAKNRSVAPKVTAPLAPVDNAPAHATNATATAAAPAESHTAPRSIITIPSRLPKPRMPLITHLPGALAGVPPLYATDRLRPLLPQILHVVNAYRPLPNEHPEDTATLPFGFPDVMNGDTALGQRIRGQEPDVVLAIFDRANPSARRRVFPACAVVYATQCAMWPPTVEAKRDAGLAAAAAAARTRPLRARPRVKLEPVQEEDEDTSMGSGNASLASSTSSATSTLSEASAAAGPSRSADVDMTTTPPPSSASAVAEALVAALRAPLPTSQHPDCPPMGYATSPVHPTYTDLPAGTVRLPIMNIPSPHPESFPMLHTHLHLPQHPLMPMLLSYPPKQGPWSVDDVTLLPYMAAKSKHWILQRMELMRGFWSNVCAMGVSAEHTWSGLSDAWTVCVRELERRGHERSPVQEGLIWQWPGVGQ